MRILLTASASYVPPRGGSTRSNLAWLRQLVGAGHRCLVVCGAVPEEQARREIAEQRIEVKELSHEAGVRLLDNDGLEVCSVDDPARLRSVLAEQIERFQPDWVLVSTEDLGQVLLRQAHQSAPGRVIYLAHTPQMFPFGPDSLNPNPQGADLVRRSAAVIAIGPRTAEQIRAHAGITPVIVHPPMYGSDHGPRTTGHGFVLMVNPCAVKGLSIFLGLADRFPEVRFAALPGWGTTAEVRAELARRRNVEILPKARDIGDVLARARLLVMPSLWPEGFGLIVVEAMLRGLPVLASDLGGLVDAKLGTNYTLPVRPIERYHAVFDAQGMPIPEIPLQDLEPWADALRGLLADEVLYRRESDAALEAAVRFVSTVRPDALEKFLERFPKAERGLPLRLLLAHNSGFYPAHGGGDKSNRLLLEALAERGHVCRVVARASKKPGSGVHARFLEELAARGVEVRSQEGGVVRYFHNGIEIHTATEHPNLRAYFAAQIEDFRPDVILASTDDPAQLLLQVAVESRIPVVYMARTTLALPCGPEAAFVSEEATALLRQCSAVVGVSQYVADYIRRCGGIPAVHVPISLLGPGPYPALGRFENEFVTMVNPCAIKGISIFLELARRLPEARFAAVPIWGTNERDIEELRRLPNVQILPPVDNIDDLLARTRVLLAPSLWVEARSRIVVEALLRGVPVLASRVGGIPEAMMGLDYLLPVNQITHYRPQMDEQMVPLADVPEQDAGPWYAALHELLTDRERYRALSEQSRARALEYAAGLSAVPFEQILRQAAAAPGAGQPAAHSDAARLLEKLSPEKRALLALRLRKKTAPGNAWFPGIESQEGVALRLFCFPYAGGGSSAFRGWNGRLPNGVAVCPARLPGRETRLSEPPLERIEALVDGLAAAMEPHLARPYVLFGHSMGALLAFELARRFRAQGRPAPRALFVSAARAPQFRLGHAPLPEPTQEEFLEELKKRQGTPRELLENAELMRLILPALRADAAVCRVYAYQPEPPFDFPIRAYSGQDDPNLRPEHIEPWARHTTADFALRLFPGGHFFLHTAQDAFLEALSGDLDELIRNVATAAR